MSEPIDSQNTVTVVQRQVQAAFITTACFHGALLSEDEIEKLNIDPESVTRDPDVLYDDSVDNSCTKVIYRDANQHEVRAAKMRIGQLGDSDIKEKLSRHYVQVYISTYLNVNTDLFMKKYVFGYLSVLLIVQRFKYFLRSQ